MRVVIGCEALTGIGLFCRVACWWRGQVEAGSEDAARLANALGTPSRECEGTLGAECVDLRLWRSVGFVEEGIVFVRGGVAVVRLGG